MQEEGHTNRCLDGRDPTALYEHYLRQLVLVASHGNDQARRLFIRAHQSALGGYAGYLLHLSEEHLRVAFVDALTAQQGSWPETLMGFRLAVPARPPDRRTDVWSLWKGLVDHQPGGLAVDPVCGMFVDPHDAPYAVCDGVRTVYFCCPRCLDAYVPATPGVLEVRRRPSRRDPGLQKSA